MSSPLKTLTFPINAVVLDLNIFFYISACRCFKVYSCYCRLILIKRHYMIIIEKYIIWYWIQNQPQTIFELLAYKRWYFLNTLDSCSFLLYPDFLTTWVTLIAMWSNKPARTEYDRHAEHQSRRGDRSNRLGKFGFSKILFTDHDWTN